MKNDQTEKNPFNYCLELVETLSRDEKKELIGQVEISIIRAHERRRKEVSEQGMEPAEAFTPEELSAYVNDMHHWPDAHEVPS